MGQRVLKVIGRTEDADANVVAVVVIETRPRGAGIPNPDLVRAEAHKLADVLFEALGVQTVMRLHERLGTELAQLSH